MPLKFKRKFLKYLPFIKLSSLIFILLFFLWLIYYFFLPIYRFIQKNNISPSFFSSLFFNSQLPLKKNQDRTNIAILGMPGGAYDGSDLTDSILFMSIGYNNSDTIIVSLPRDIWITSLKTKINSVYHYGEERLKGGGLVLVKSAIEEVVGQPVHYAYLIDFSGFQKIVDLVGGIEVNIESGFIDNYFPIPGRENDNCNGDEKFSCRYEKLEFLMGRQHLDGDKALKFVRSRQSEGEEGTDFAREKRQQKVLLAIKDKISKLSFWSNPFKIKQLVDGLNEVFITDMNWSEKALFFKYFLTLSERKIRRLVLSDFFINPPLWKYNGLWVLEPKIGNFDEVKQYITCSLKNSNCSLHR